MTGSRSSEPPSGNGRLSPAQLSDGAETANVTGTCAPANTARQSSLDFSRHLRAIDPSHGGSPDTIRPLLSRGFTSGRYRTRTCDLCRVKEDPRRVTISAIGPSRVAKGHETAGQPACPSQVSTAHDDPIAEMDGRFSRHFRAIAAPSVIRKWRGCEARSVSVNDADAQVPAGSPACVSEEPFQLGSITGRSAPQPTYP